HVDGPGAHLRLRELICPARAGDRVLLTLILVRGLLHRTEGVLHVTERRDDRLVVVRQQLGVARLRELVLSCQRAAREDLLRQRAGQGEHSVGRREETRQRGALEATVRCQGNAWEKRRAGRGDVGVGGNELCLG